MLAEIECDEGHELMLQGNDSVSVAKDVDYEANEVSEKSPDCRKRKHAAAAQATSNHTDSTRGRERD